MAKNLNGINILHNYFHKSHLISGYLENPGTCVYMYKTAEKTVGTD
jgi:hypothetical protein